MFELSEIIR
jgi:hypothetical protein